jgi:ATP-dependent DNA helicase RecQ
MATDTRVIDDTLRETFGFSGFRPGQEAVVAQLVAGNSALAVFPTGSGKSLCYQLTALLLDGVTLVVSPLIALMKDQIDFLRAHGVAAARLDSSIGIEEIRRTDAALRDGTLKLLYVAPERFSNERFLDKLRGLDIALFVIDEAHCISEWGHNFRPDYLKLARITRGLGVERVLALTATATPDVAADICREFAIAPEGYVHTGFYRPNLVLHATACRPEGRLEMLIRRLRERPRGATIVYVTLQRTAESVADALTRAGFTARAYHAGMESEERAAVQDWFMASPQAVVVATIAFGMGIDKSDIRAVYHFNLPKSLENYSQEIGRAGRDGAEAFCEILACSEDVTSLENFTYGDTPDAAGVGGLVDAVLGGGDTFDVSIYELSGAHDVRPLVVNTLLTYLELADVIEATAPFYNEYKFQFLRPEEEILARFDAGRATFLREVFSCAKEARKWRTLDLATAVERLATSRERLTRAIGYLEEKGDIELKVAGVRQGYRVKTRPADLAALKQSLADRFETRERNDVARPHQVLALIEAPGCIVRQLLAHFGEDLGRNCGHCGHCGPCLGEPPAKLPSRGTAGTIQLDREEVDSLQQAHPEALGTPRQMARFLCGLNSPRTTRARLGRHPLFGSLQDRPFRVVMDAVGREDAGGARP